MKRVFPLFLLTAFALASGLGANPSIVEYRVPATRTQAILGAIELSLSGATAVRAQLVDWQEDPDGELLLLPAGSLKRSLARWIKLQSSRLEAQNGRATLRYRIEIPPQPEGSYHAAILLEPADENPRPAGPGLLIRQRLVVMVPVYLFIQGSERPSLRILQAKVQAGEGVFWIENDGNVALHAKARLEGVSAQGEVVESTLLLDEELLPGERRRVRAPLPETPVWRLIVRAPGVPPLVWEGSRD